MTDDDKRDIDDLRRSGALERPGQAIGRGERSTDTIPGGIGPDDERVAATQTQSTGVGDPAERGQPAEPPSGHRQGEPASDDRIREAGDRQ